MQKTHPNNIVLLSFNWSPCCRNGAQNSTPQIHPKTHPKNVCVFPLELSRVFRYRGCVFSSFLYPWHADFVTRTDGIARCAVPPPLSLLEAPWALAALQSGPCPAPQAWSACWSSQYPPPSQDLILMIRAVCLAAVTTRTRLQRGGRVHKLTTFFCCETAPRKLMKNPCCPGLELWGGGRVYVPPCCPG